MSKNIQLTIADPCHQNWDQMTQAEQGRYCASCQKQVVDFTNMSDSQLAAFFKKPTTGTVCGRFFQDQLERDIEIPRKRIPWVKYFFQFALPAFLVSMKATAQGNVRMGKPAIAVPAKDTKEQKHKKDTIPSAGLLIAPAIKVPEQKEISLQNVITSIPSDVKSCSPILGGELIGVAGMVSTSYTKPKKVSLIKGIVIDWNGKKIPDALIEVRKNSYTAFSDRKGKFYLPLSVNDTDSAILNVSCIGYEGKVVVIYKNNRPDNLIIQLEPVNNEVVIVAGLVIPKEIKSIPLIQQKLMDTSFNFFKVFPNPVPSGASLHIEWKKTEEGYYKFELLDVSGKIVHSREIWVDTEARLLNFEVPSLTAGNYFLRATNKLSGKSFTEKIIIQ
jgi:Secretion system C-terminal sorting domain